MNLVITRELNAPVSRVWEMWTVPSEMMKWWGPKPFTAPVIKSDFKVGGKYHYCMRSPDGQDYWSTGTYKEIVPMKKIVCTDSFSNAEGDVVSAEQYGMKDFPLEMTVTIDFEEMEPGKTKMTISQGPHPEGEMKKMATEGWSTSLEKLAENL
jgi:uncharacterized protein YndB with AHSA1/START domain